MNDSDLLRRNIQLAFEVAHTAVGDAVAATELAKISRGGGLVLADPSDPELSLANEALADELMARGERVVLAQVRKSATVEVAKRSS